MISTEIYTLDELKQWTRTHRRAEMIRVLIDNRVPYIIAADGWPSVDRRDAMAALNVVSLQTRRDGEPDFDALDDIA
ncbi:MAG TPA: DUF4224 domain-containing protein [Acidimicrobiia bacterium]